ncbi:MAG: HAMP domain-containing protein [Alphaproteobacteria bacterium]|nr:HAMP domain-containing protein [Alphaproteobacteria bacterium]
MKSLSSLSATIILDAAAFAFVVFTAAAFASGQGQLALLFCAVAALAAAGGFLSALRVRRKVQYATRVCRQLAKGDFETRVTAIDESGEIGEMLWSINEMTDHMDAFVREATASMEYVSRNQYFRRIVHDGMHGSLLSGSQIINRATKNVGIKMGGFLEVANDFNSNLNEVVREINATVGTLEEMARTMESTVASSRRGAETALDATRETSGNAQSISAAAEEMSSSIREISEQITRTSQIAARAKEQTASASQTVSELVGYTRTISEVIKMIEEIAKQTNLLALNATIEAARAGEAGKGFTVVASEVKDLSAETARATEDIVAQVAAIQQATDSAAEVFEGIAKIIDEINESATVVAAAIEEQSAASREIAQNADRAYTSTDGVVCNVQGISESIDHVSQAADKVLSVTGELSQQSTEKVRVLLGKMNVFMDELKKIA